MSRAGPRRLLPPVSTMTGTWSTSGTRSASASVDTVTLSDQYSRLFTELRTVASWCHRQPRLLSPIRSQLTLMTHRGILLQSTTWSMPLTRGKISNLAFICSNIRTQWVVHEILETAQTHVADRRPTGNKTRHSQDFCNKLRASWAVTLQNSRSFVCTI